MSTLRVGAPLTQVAHTIEVVTSDGKTIFLPRHLADRVDGFNADRERLMAIMGSHNYATYDDALVAAASSGGRRDTALLIRSGANPAAQNNRSIKYAAAAGHTEVVRLLLAQERVDADARAIAIYMAARYGHAAVVALMLADDKTNPVQWDNSRDAAPEHQMVYGRASPDVPIGVAAENGHIEVVRLLMADRRVLDFIYPDAALICLPLCRAAAGGSLHVVNLLLTEYPSFMTEHFEALMLAIKRGHADVTSVLLADAHVNPDAQTIRALLTLAVELNHVGVMEVLLKDGRFDRAADNTATLFNASSAAAVRVLLAADTGIVPTHRAFMNAVHAAVYEARDNDIDCLIEFLRDPRTDPSANANEAILKAVYSPTVVRLLLDAKRGVDPTMILPDFHASFIRIVEQYLTHDMDDEDLLSVRSMLKAWCFRNNKKYE